MGRYLTPYVRILKSRTPTPKRSYLRLIGAGTKIILELATALALCILAYFQYRTSERLTELEISKTHPFFQLRGSATERVVGDFAPITLATSLPNDRLSFVIGDSYFQFFGSGGATCNFRVKFAFNFDFRVNSMSLKREVVAFLRRFDRWTIRLTVAQVGWIDYDNVARLTKTYMVAQGIVIGNNNNWKNDLDALPDNSIKVYVSPSGELWVSDYDITSGTLGCATIIDDVEHHKIRVKRSVAIPTDYD